MLYYFIYKSLPLNIREWEREYDLNRGYSVLRVTLNQQLNGYLSYYFDQRDQWDD